jgi:release factor glutamine methyltransferase
MEIGQGQREAIAELLAGWGEVRFVEDLRGIARVVVARRG